MIGGGFLLVDSVVKGILCDTVLYWKSTSPKKNGTLLRVPQLCRRGDQDLLGTAFSPLAPDRVCCIWISKLSLA